MTSERKNKKEWEKALEIGNWPAGWSQKDKDDAIQKIEAILAICIKEGRRFDKYEATMVNPRSLWKYVPEEYRYKP